MVRKADKAFQSFEKTVLERDNYSCQFCGFESHLYQEVVNLDGDYTRNPLSNLVTACPFCVQCCFIDAVGMSDFGGGTLIYLPEVSQVQLNASCHVIFSALAMGATFTTQASNLYRSYKLRTQLVEKEFGEGLSNPALLGRLLIESEEMVSSSFREAVQENIRLLPQLSRYTEQMYHWSMEGISLCHNGFK